MRKTRSLFICAVFLLSGLMARASDDSLQALVDRSDLIIVATPQTACGMSRGSGPWVKPGEDKLVARYDEFLPQLKIEKVLKGDVNTDKELWISYTVINMANGKNMVLVEPKEDKAVFNVGSRKHEDETELPGSPHKGVAYIFFLENRKMQEPKSYEAAGTNEIIYRNFDYHVGMPANDALALKVSELAKTKKS